jgi:NAD-dependent DNA ligase
MINDTKLIEQNPKKYASSLKIDDLADLLKKLSDAYYNTDKSLVSDDTYDTLVDVLTNRDPDNKFLKTVGAPIKGTKKKVDLPFEMGSLSKIKPGKNDIEKWEKKYKGPYIISDKLDGGSAQVYKNQAGNVFMFSRGDGTTGQDITHLLKYVVSKETLETLPKGTSIRGELIISKDNFKKIKNKMKNPRNAVAGLINSKTVNIDVAKATDLIAYAVLNPRYEYKKQMELLEKWDFNVVNHQFVKNISEQSLTKYLTTSREKGNYEMDGTVCIDCSKVYSHAGGRQDHEFAFKIDNPGINTTVKKVEWNPSKDGYLIPTVWVEPVDMDGTTTKKATGKNAKFVINNEIGPGAIVKITKGGDIIPDIIEIIKPAKVQMPPFPYKWNSTKVDLILKDENDTNGKQMVTIKVMDHFFSKLGIKYLSEGIITKLVEAGYDSIAKILAADKDDLSEIDGLGEKVVDKIYKEIDHAFNEMTLETFMAASNKLGRSLGTRKITEIINMYPNIMKEPENGLHDKIMKVPGFSNTLTDLFVANFKSFKKFYDEIAKIKDLSRFTNITTKKTSDKFKGQSFVFTGARNKDAEKYIIENGGKVSTSVSSKTSFLIHANDADTSTNKFVKAKEAGVKIIKISDFIKKYTNL